jgi:hypothetical protein
LAADTLDFLTPVYNRFMMLRGAAVRVSCSSVSS